MTSRAVTLHTGLLAARHVLGADVIVVAQGPGNLGTGTRWGFSGVACGEAVNAAAVLGGRPVASLRVSEADPRERHYGVSHHSLTAYGRVALARADVVVPELPGAFGARVAAQAAGLAGRHTLVSVSTDGLAEALRGCPVPLSSMGRGLDEDLAYFLAAAAAGRHAAALLERAPAGPGRDERADQDTPGPGRAGGSGTIRTAAPGESGTRIPASANYRPVSGPPPGCTRWRPGRIQDRWLLGIGVSLLLSDLVEPVLGARTPDRRQAAATGGSGPRCRPGPPPGQPAEDDGLIAPRMSTTNTSVSVPLIPAWVLPVFP